MSVALVPSNPVSPNRTRNLMLGFLLGCLLSGGIVVARMILDDKYKTTEDIRRYTGLITLAVVPVEEIASTSAKSKKKANSSRRQV